jgi:hypothetical protein
MSESEQPARQPPDEYGQPISDDRQRLLQQRLDAWATEASHDLIGPYDSVALTGADVFWLAERSGRGADGGAPNLLLQGARLQSAHLEGADLRGAHLERANLHSANLQGARFNGAHLEGASLEAANLDGAELADAHFAGANFNGARLQGTILSGVDLRRPEPPVKGNYLTGCLWVSSIYCAGAGWAVQWHFRIGVQSERLSFSRRLHFFLPADILWRCHWASGWRHRSVSRSCSSEGTWRLGFVRFGAGR